MENKKILLIGFGNIGTRYYEGVIKSKKNFKLFIFDKDNHKYFKKKKNFVHFLKNLESTRKIKDLFLVMIATTADNRGSLLNKLNLSSKYWIIEKPLGSSLKQIDLIEKRFKLIKNAYVNIPRENWKIYKKIKKIFKYEKFQMEVNGTNWNLVSNCFHFFRLFEWINDSKIMSINADCIKSWFSSKRKDYFEADGLLSAKLLNGSTCSLISKKTTDGKKRYTVSLISNKNTIYYNEMSGKLKINKKKYNYKIPLLSEEIHSYLKNFLLHKKVNLPKVKSQIIKQKLILEELETNWTKKFKRKTQFRIT